jgi:hypothetical protein
MNSATGDRKGERDEEKRIKININKNLLEIYLTFLLKKPKK